MSALSRLAGALREDPVIAPHVSDPAGDPALGELVAAGPRASSAADEYTLLFEAIREGYLVHYRDPRLLAAADPDLRLLAGDYLYALGLERLAALDDLDSVSELADLISLSAALEARRAEGHDTGEALAALWLASAIAVGAGADRAHRAAKDTARDGTPAAPPALWAWARETAAQAGMSDQLARAADSIGFAAQDLLDSG